ncbi:MAG TPA: PTS sugar transporter subunit IIC [Gemmatimonadales bacterium]|nr:PTS sugar transporter subunit IIC [Gemmatimonadales bacterium]
MSPELTIALLLWGTLVGLDLVSVPQMMIARPLIAGPVAGAILGDLEAGLKLGVVFELLQYDILPVGAVRYPEYGPATVGAVATAHASAGVLGLGLGTLVGLLTGLVGGVTIHLLRRINGRAVQAAAATLESGDPRQLARVHVAAILRDALRAALVTAFGLGLAWAAPPLLGAILTLRGITLLAVAAVAAALAAGAAGTLRLVGRGPNLAWFAAGLGGGVLVAGVLR